MKVEFSVSPGVLGLIGCAGSKKKSEEFTFYMGGDLSQMSKQESHLHSIGVETTHSDVFPVIKGVDVKRALESIFKNRVEGWWHYQSKYEELGICSAEEFDSALDERVKADRARDRTPWVCACGKENEHDSMECSNPKCDVVR